MPWTDLVSDVRLAAWARWHAHNPQPLWLAAHGSGQLNALCPLLFAPLIPETTQHSSLQIRLQLLNVHGTARSFPTLRITRACV